MGARVRRSRAARVRAPRGATDGRQRGHGPGDRPRVRRRATTTSPNPWVGCVVLATDGTVFEGATAAARRAPRRGRSRSAAAGRRPGGPPSYITLEPCSHHGRTPPCADALIDAGVARVVVGLDDPDPQVAGQGIARLRAAGIDVEVGVRADEVAEQLAAYLNHRRTGRP